MFSRKRNIAMILFQGLLYEFHFKLGAGCRTFLRSRCDGVLQIIPRQLCGRNNGIGAKVIRPRDGVLQFANIAFPTAVTQNLKAFLVDLFGNTSVFHV